MRLGFHLSIAGGFVRAVEQGLRTGCEAAQIFSGNPRGWDRKPVSADGAAGFRRAVEAAGLRPIAVHLPYLPNLAAEADGLWDKSVAALIDEFERAALLGADFIVTHPGHAHGDTEAALDRVASGVLRALAAPGAAQVALLLETTAGQRGEIGSTFEELSGIIRRIDAKAPAGTDLGVCLDTAHVWAAGYDVGRPDGLAAVLADFDRAVGLDRLRMIHFNDSLSELSGRRDRHAAVGRGKIGARGMANIVRHPALAHLAGIMETPKQTEADDVANMARAKGWRKRKKI